MGSVYDNVHFTAEGLRLTGDDQDAYGFHHCLHGITWRGVIGDNFSFDEYDDVVGLANVAIETLPVAQRTNVNNGFRVLGPVPGDSATPPATPGFRERGKRTLGNVL